MRGHYGSFFASVTLGAGLGILAGLYSVLQNSEYIESRLLNLALFQFQRAFNAPAILLIVIGSVPFFVIRRSRVQHYVAGRKAKILTLLGTVGTMSILLLLAHLSGSVRFPVIEGGQLVMRLPLRILGPFLFALFSLAVWLLTLRLARGLCWPSGRTLLTIAFLLVLGVNTTGLVARIAISGGPEDGLNVVLISIDTIRADHLSCYGYSQNTSPNVHAFADEAIRFEKVVVPMAHTLPSHVSMFTGLYPQSHGVKMNGGFLRSEIPTLTEVLKNAGYSTAAFVGCKVLDRNRGLAPGFDIYDDETYGERTRLAEAVTSSAQRWLDRHAKERFFVFIHFWDPHAPYDPPAPFGDMFHQPSDSLAEIYCGHRYRHEYLKELYGDFHDRDLAELIQQQIGRYDGEVRYVDEEIGKLIKHIKELEVWDNTLTIITGDHGETLGERGWWGHGLFYEEQILVPLLVRCPGKDAGQRVINDTVRLIDLFPTILSLLRLECTIHTDGESITPLLEGLERSTPCVSYLERRPYPATMRLEQPWQWGLGREYAVRTDGWKLVYKVREEDELYNLMVDPGETHNLITRERELSAEMRNVLLKWLGEVTSNDEGEIEGIDSDTLELLRALGYIR